MRHERAKPLTRTWRSGPPRASRGFHSASQDAHGHNAVAGPQRSISGSDAPTSPSRWRRSCSSAGSSQEGSGHGSTLWRGSSQAGGGVQGGSMRRDGSSGELGSASAHAGDGVSEQQAHDVVVVAGMNRAAHVGAVGGPLLDFVRWDLLPDAPTGAYHYRIPMSRLPCVSGPIEVLVGPEPFV